MAEPIVLLYGPLDGMALRSYGNSPAEIAIPHIHLNEPGPAAFEHVYGRVSDTRYKYQTTRKLKCKYVKRNNRNRPRTKGGNISDQAGSSGQGVENACDQVGNEINPESPGTE